MQPIAEVFDLEQAFDVIERMDSSAAKNMERFKEVSALKAKRDAVLNGRSLEAVNERAEYLRTKLSRIKNLEDFQPERLAECKRELETLADRIGRIAEDAARLEGEIESLRMSERTPEMVENEINAHRIRLEKYRSAYAAAELAKNVLSAANEEMGSAFAPGINATAAKVLSEITAGAYDDVRVSEALEPVVLDKTSGALVEKDFLSSGTVDQLYLALRLAVASKLFEGDRAVAPFDGRSLCSV